jgi:branched-chain amino acid transport system permease protein
VLVMNNVFESATPITGGLNGLAGIPQLSVGSLDLGGPVAQLASFVFITAVVVATLVALKRSPLGLSMKAVREQPSVTQVSGKNITFIQLIAFILGGGIAALAGSMYAVLIGYVDPTAFTASAAFLIVAMLILGGTGNIAGAVVGGAVLSLLPNVLSYLPVSAGASATIPGLVYGLLVLLVIRYRPQGIMPERVLKKYRRERPDSTPIRDKAASGNLVRVPKNLARAAASGAPLIEAQEISRSFDGVQAVSNVQLVVRPGERVAIIGANGAGKTSLINILTGFDNKASGVVRYSGSSVRLVAPHAVARTGSLRTFQDVRMFRELSVLENILVYALPFDRAWPLLLSGFRGRGGFPADAIANAYRLVERLGLSSKADKRAGELSYGEQKLLSVGRVLAKQDWKILLLDEPMSGLTTKEIDDVLTLLDEYDSPERALVLIEHNIEFVFRFATRVVVMDHGRVIADDYPDRVRMNADVRKAYLG